MQPTDRFGDVRTREGESPAERFCTNHGQFQNEIEQQTDRGHTERHRIHPISNENGDHTDESGQNPHRSLADRYECVVWVRYHESRRVFDDSESEMSFIIHVFVNYAQSVCWRSFAVESWEAAIAECAV